MKILGSDKIPADDDHVRWVAVEIEEFLHLGQVGLYEVVDSLRARYPVKSDSEYLPDARRIVALLLDLELGVLQRVKWAKGPIGPLLAADDLTDAWFDAPTKANGDEFVVLQPNHSTDPAPQFAQPTREAANE